ncbi:trypsin-like peptidase domain-containing protein [Halobellus sp. GM3]|uniref:trypsin-like peptidase domain-containing protein n=1 Tax=Halobellus sp. GM3 TaxID=3458410 RepID=UPI00403DB81C
MADPTPTRRRLLELGGAAVVAALAGCSTEAPRADAGTTPDSGGNDSSHPASEAPASPYARVYRQAVDSVVLVRTDRGQGSGFVVEASNADSPTHLVTNAHVVAEASTADVRFSEGRWSTGTVVGTDPHSDLAVVSLPDSAPAVEPLVFAEGDATVGQEVVAIGNPFDLGGTVTTGVVSGVDRSAPAPTGSQIPDAIQTDAAVNPGNSGGPLMSLEGRVVAIINSGGGENIAFGISAALARRVVPRLIEDGTYEHSFVGVTLTGVTPALAREIGMSEPRGILVTDVLEDAPAAGVLRGGSETRVVGGTRVNVGGDVLLAIDGQTIRTIEDLGSYLALETRPGDTVELTVRRDGAVTTVDVELGTRPS